MMSEAGLFFAPVREPPRPVGMRRRMSDEPWEAHSLRAAGPTEALDPRSLEAKRAGHGQDGGPTQNRTNRFHLNSEPRQVRFRPCREACVGRCA